MAVRHSNSVDFWVIAHQFGSDAFYSYLVNSTGVSTTPVVSNVGSTLGGSDINAIGQLKSNAAGNRIANALYDIGAVELFDFDNATGLLSNTVSITTGSWCYGVEFSPNGNYLYSTWSPGSVAQYDLLAGTPTDIENSEVSLASSLFDFYTALQRAPDGKIYVAKDLGTSIGVISNPDLSGTSANFNGSGFNLGGAISNQGLPNFVNEFSPLPTLSHNICEGDTVTLSSFNNSTCNWADTAAPNIILSTNPNFAVWPLVSTAYICYGNVDTLIFSVTVNQLPNVDLGNDTVFCAGNGYLINISQPNVTYLWYNNSTLPAANISGTGTYWVAVTNDCGTTIDSLNVIAGGIQTELTDFANEGCVGTNNGIATFANIVGEVGDSITVTWTNPAGMVHDIDQVVQGGTVSQTDLYAGTWTVTFEDSIGCSWDTTLTFLAGAIDINTNLGHPQCFGTPTGSITAFSNSQGTFSFVIQDSSGTIVNSQGTNTANSLLAGIYTVSYTDDNGCVLLEEVELTDPLPIIPNISLTHPECYGDETGTATVDTVFNTQGDYDQSYYNWTPNPMNNNGLGTTAISGLSAGEYVLEVVDDTGCSNQVVFHILQPNPLIGIVDVVSPTFCRTTGDQAGNGEVTVTTAGIDSSGAGNVTYLWENLENGDVSTNTTFIVNVPGLMRVTLEDANGCTFIDTIRVDSLNPMADFDPLSDEFTGPGEFEGVGELEVRFINQSVNFSKPTDPLSDTTFVWNLYTNDPNADGQGNWFFSFEYDEKIERTYAGEEKYLVCLVAKNFNDCRDTACKEIIVHEVPGIIAPNVFTPGADPNNEFYFPTLGIAEFECHVFNRYGIEVYQFNGINDRWDGTNFKNGEPCVEGVYFYNYVAKTASGTLLEGNGKITLIRSK